MDAVIHNAGIYIGPNDLPVNVVAPYLLTMLIDRPAAGLPQLQRPPQRTTQPDQHGLELSSVVRFIPVSYFLTHGGKGG
jgi:hypothetical protein